MCQHTLTQRSTFDQYTFRPRQMVLQIKLLTISTYNISYVISNNRKITYVPGYTFTVLIDWDRNSLAKYQSLQTWAAAIPPAADGPARSRVPARCRPNHYLLPAAVSQLNTACKRLASFDTALPAACSLRCFYVNNNITFEFFTELGCNVFQYYLYEKDISTYDIF